MRSVPGDSAAPEEGELVEPEAVGIAEPAATEAAAPAELPSPAAPLPAIVAKERRSRWGSMVAAP